MKIESQRREQPELQCLYCRDGFVPGLEPALCEGCQAVYHHECLIRELEGACATPGCGAPWTGPSETALEEALEEAPLGARQICCSRQQPASDPLVYCGGCQSLSHHSCLESRGGVRREGARLLPLAPVGLVDGGSIGPRRAPASFGLFVVAGIGVPLLFIVGLAVSAKNPGLSLLLFSLALGLFITALVNVVGARNPLLRMLEDD